MAIQSYPQTGLLSVVMPVFNERDTIRGVAERVLALPDLREIVIVDDGSTDGTSEVLARLAGDYAEIVVITQPENRGKTAALAAAFSKTSGEIVVVQDADLEYDPTDIPDLIEPIKTGRADVVYGSRFLVKRASRVLYFYHYLGNRMLTLLSNVLTNLNMTDIETGYKAFRGEIIRSMVIESSGFGFEAEVTAKVAKLRCAIYEVPVSYYGRTYDEGKKVTWADGVAALYYLFRFNLFCSLSRSFRRSPQELCSGRSRESKSDQLLIEKS